MRARPAVSPAAPSAIAKTAEPAAAITNSPDMVRRGPNRSRSTPVGTCMRPNARKKAPVITPIASDEMERVRMSSGAITAFETRKNWLATNPAQSTASMRAAMRERAEARVIADSCPPGIRGEFPRTRICDQLTNSRGNTRGKIHGFPPSRE